MLIIILFLISIPIAVVILLFEFAIRKEENKHITKKVRNVILIGLYVFLTSIVIYDWLERRHVLTFQLDNEYDVILVGIEQESFMDWPVDFNLEIYSRSTHTDLTTSISCYEGPFIQFSTSDNYPGIILLDGYQSNAHLHWTIDMNTNKIQRSQHQKKDQFSIKAQISYAFELEFISH